MDLINIGILSHAKQYDIKSPNRNYKKILLIDLVLNALTLIVTSVIAFSSS